uniref:Protein kinase domain-containing protein n=1 Tax=viral metagenome TaxID=1070528 RepID=A0A6C0BP30_9ZZZZ
MSKLVDVFWDDQGTECQREWQQGELLGTGAHAKVYHMRAGDVEAAGKCVLKSSLEKQYKRQHLRSEIRIHRHLDHPNVVKFISWFETPEQFTITMELCENQSLYTLLKSRKVILG